MQYLITPNGITLATDKGLRTINEGGSIYLKIMEAVRSGDFSNVPVLLDPSLRFKHLKDVELKDGTLYIKGKSIGHLLSNRVLKFAEQDLPFEPLLKFAENLRANPSYNSRQMLYEFLEHNGHPITSDGCFIAYRKVRTNFKDCHTGTMDNSVGRVVEMPREEVDDNPNNTCSSGLHVATYEYAKDFSSGHLLEVKVDPKDVVAVPRDYDGTKMRVCRFEVMKVCESKLETELYDDIGTPDNECPECGYEYEPSFDRYCANCGGEL